MQNYTHFFYADLDIPSTETDYANWELRMYDLTGNLIENLGSVSVFEVTTGNRRFYKEFVIPEVGTAGYRFFAIVNSSTSSVKFQSDIFLVIKPTEYSKYALVQYKHSTDRDNMDYEETFFDSKYQSLFLDLNLIDFDYEYTKEGYEEQSTGIYREQQSRRRHFMTLEAYLFNKNLCDAMMSLSDHDDILINGETVTVKQGFAPEFQRDMNVWKGSIQFYIQRYATTNLNG